MNTKLIIAITLCSGLTACSAKLIAVNMLGDALSQGAGVYTSDNDPDLIREALPFGLKTYESLLNISPEHERLLLATANGFTAYAYLLEKQADIIDEVDFSLAHKLRKRSSNLYLRGRDYALRGLELNHTGITERLIDQPSAALAETSIEDVPMLYWAGVSWAAALSADKGNFELIADLPIAAAMVGRVLELDESYEHGAAHEFFVSYEGSRPGGSADVARTHYQKALELSQGKRASTHLALAEAVVIREQNLTEFRSLITAALEVDSDAVPELRLINTLSKQRALWLEVRIPEMFVDVD